MNQEELIHLFNKEQRIEIEFPGCRREVSGPVIRQISLNGENGFIIYSELEEDQLDACIQEQLAYYKQLGQTFEWKVYDYDRPAGLRNRLEVHGFEIGEPEALLIMQLQPGSAILERAIPSDLIRITDAAGVDDLIALEDEIWGESHAELGQRLKDDLLNDPDHLLIYAHYEGGRAVCASWMYLHKGTSFGSLWGGSTLPEYRGRGLYTSLVAVRAQEAWKRGFRFLMVDASPMSRPILEAKGFAFIGYSYPCVSPK